jgi:ElaB/YqjD/DUF883 family membrane-anchored ribosome-binding protein
MNEHVSGSIAEIGADLAALRGDVAKLADALRGTLDQQAKSAGNGVSDALADASGRVAHAAGDVQKGARAASAEVGASIERNPLTAMLIALAAGVAIGALGRSHG